MTALGEWDEAAACYRESANIFREIGRPTMPPEPIAGLARLALARGDLAAASEATAEVVSHFDAGGSVDGTEDPLWIYLTCHDVLRAAGEPRALEFLRLAHEQLTKRAELLGDAERATLLDNVPTHRAIVAAWAAREAKPAPAERLPTYASPHTIDQFAIAVGSPEAARRRRRLLAGIGSSLMRLQADVGRPGPTHRKSASWRGLVLTMSATSCRSSIKKIAPPTTGSNVLQTQPIRPRKVTESPKRSLKDL